MKLATAAITFCSLALGAFGRLPRAEYREFIPSWEVEVRPGETAILNGTIQEVRAELLKRNPDWDTQYPVQNTTKRDPGHMDGWNYINVFPKDTKILCGIWSRSEAWTAVLINFALSLDRAAKIGQPKNGAGPGNCGRVGCEYNTGIWWCNDSPEPKTLSSFTDITDAIQVLQYTKDCSAEGSAQVFHPDNWNVIVSGKEGLEC
ncbi:Uncharacterized protein TPAR_08133 [Tolypocladium paradoxum]|uniref:Ecp2 effector protein domain-containing protein n=1 Tax=Tolypocladium paradoxum TaxID=94208 RepID=A0A2S4KN71_9HYPO|nr:Uncharacterized protein TPAR_08133 [Tolypocladium paradoxum]